MSSAVHQIVFSSGSRARLWRALQLAGVVATAALLSGLMMWPKQTLAVLWNVVVPILPASFVLSPALWRNVCPLATLNSLSNGLVSRRALPPALGRAAYALGILLLLVLVPARRFLFNTNGPALAAVIVAVALIALSLGAVFDMKAGFCNAICPVLPVERLYGQRPLLSVENPRCVECTQCSVRGCIDFSPTKSIAQVLGPKRRTSAWLATPFGAFAAAFPGFITGYYTLADGRLDSASHVYPHVAAWMAGSWMATAFFVTGFRIRVESATTVLAVAAVGLYYWFAAPLVATTLGAGSVGATVIRLLAGLLLAVWLVRPRLVLRAGGARGRPFAAIGGRRRRP